MEVEHKMKKFPLIGINIVVVCLIVLASFTNVVGVKTIEPSINKIINDEIGQKDILYYKSYNNENKIDNNFQKKLQKENLCFFNFHIEIINKRLLFWQEPNSEPPGDGYPVVFLFHGAVQSGFAWFIGLTFWSKNQKEFTNLLLDNGFLVIAPDSKRPVFPGPKAWDAFRRNMSENSDLIFVKNIINWLDTLPFKVNKNKIFCAGFSSGAFMCSRIGHAFGSNIAGLVVHSGANANAINLTGTGPFFDCTSPQSFSSDYPPTLVVHGGKDWIVPTDCGIHFYDELVRNGIDADLLIDENQGHIWIKEFNDDIVDWIKSKM